MMEQQRAATPTSQKLAGRAKLQEGIWLTWSGLWRRSDVMRSGSSKTSPTPGRRAEAISTRRESMSPRGESKPTNPTLIALARRPSFRAVIERTSASDHSCRPDLALAWQRRLGVFDKLKTSKMCVVARSAVRVLVPAISAKVWATMPIVPWARVAQPANRDCTRPGWVARFGFVLRQLCQSISRSRLDCRGIELQFVGRPLEMNSERCWRLSMIISELITNAARHAFGDGGGKIRVKLSRCGPFIKCRVADDGTAPEKIRPGRGFAIVEGLIASLEGTINQHFGPGGAVSDVIFPACSWAKHTSPPAVFPTSRDTVLRIGPLELDLIERTARRGDRAIDLLPREFRLLEYMMRPKDQLLTRAMLLQGVWHYKFVPKSNLVNVHMGRLLRKVDKPQELPMIYNVRGFGFILSVSQTLSCLAVDRESDDDRAQ